MILVTESDGEGGTMVCECGSMDLSALPAPLSDIMISELRQSLF